MPMIWDARADAKLYALTLHVCDVKPNQAQRTEIASRMGSECTAKAISHKISAFRKIAAKTSSPGDAGTATAAKMKNMVKKTDKNAPLLSRQKKAGAEAMEVKRESTPDRDEGAAFLVGLSTPPDSAVKGRKEEEKKSNEDDDNDNKNKNKNKNKKRKLEDDGLEDGKEIAVGEDVGQGFRRKKVRMGSECEGEGEGEVEGEDEGEDGGGSGDDDGDDDGNDDGDDNGVGL